MIKAIISITISALIAALLSSCGDQTASGENTTSQRTQTLTKYQFSATIDVNRGTPPFTAAIGDVITGTFTFDPTVNDTHISPTQGGYVQKTPAYVQVEIGNVTLNADLSNWLGYTITAFDNDPNNGLTHDILSWHINDTVTAASYGLDYIQVGFTLDDSTGQAITNAAIPSSLSLNDYNMKILFISGTKIINNIPNGLWSFRAQITSVTKVQ